MTIDEALLAEVEQARQRAEDLDDEAYRARAAFNHAVRRLHQAGGSLREIATALGMSHQRVHQIIGEEAIVELEATSTTLPVLPTQLAVTEVDDRCTACGASRRELDKLLAAPGNVFICASCVEAAPAAQRTTGTCTYCGTIGDVADLTGATICATCLQSCQRIIGRPADEMKSKVTMRRRNALIRCSFCNASQKEVKKLIAGPGVYICDLCMAAANQVAESGATLRGPRSSTLSDASRERHNCSFCGKSPQQVAHVVKGGRARICNECLKLCFDIVEAEAQ